MQLILIGNNLKLLHSLIPEHSSYRNVICLIKPEELFKESLRYKGSPVLVIIDLSVLLPGNTDLIRNSIPKFPDYIFWALTTYKDENTIIKIKGMGFDRVFRYEDDLPYAIYHFDGTKRNYQIAK